MSMKLQYVEKKPRYALNHLQYYPYCMPPPKTCLGNSCFVSITKCSIEAIQTNFCFIGKLWEFKPSVTGSLLKYLLN